MYALVSSNFSIRRVFRVLLSPTFIAGAFGSISLAVAVALFLWLSWPRVYPVSVTVHNVSGQSLRNVRVVFSSFSGNDDSKVIYDIGKMEPGALKTVLVPQEWRESRLQVSGETSDGVALRSLSRAPLDRCGRYALEVFIHKDLSIESVVSGELSD